MASRGIPANALQLHLPERWPDSSIAGADRMRWARYSGNRVDRGYSSLREVPRAATVVAVVPASRVLFVHAQLPSGRASKQEKVLAFAVEDTVGAAPEDILAVHVGQAADGQDLIAVVDRTWLKAAVGELEIQGYAPSKVILEGELLAKHRSIDGAVWTAVRLPSGGFLHVGGVETISMDLPPGVSTEPPMALNLALDEHTKGDTAPGKLEVFAAEGVAAVDLSRWSQVLAMPITAGGLWNPETLDARGLNRTNLLPALGGQRKQTVDSLNRYRFAAGLAATVLVAHLGLTAFEWFRLSSEESAMRAGMKERFLKVFPDAKSVPDPARQMSRQIGTLKRQAGEPSPDDFIAIMGKLAPVLAAANSQARSLKYERGSLQIEVSVPASETQESLSGKLRQAAGLKLQIERVQATPQGATAVLRVGAA